MASFQRLQLRQQRPSQVKGEPEDMATSVGAASGKEEDNIHSDVLLFNRWSYDDVEGHLCDCGGLHNCNRIQATYMPHTAGRHQRKCFRKAQCPIVERLTNSLMMHGRNNGKKLMAVPIVKHAVEIINLLTDLNPIQVIVDAIINTILEFLATHLQHFVCSGPREDVTPIGSAGVVRSQVFDISPLRRVNQVLYLLMTGARESAFSNIKTLADELINAAKAMRLKRKSWEG